MKTDLHADGNNSWNETAMPWAEDVMDLFGTRAIFATVYCLIFVFGICGNAMVIAAVLRTRRMHTVTNILILNLAVSDINVTVVSVVFTPLATFMKTWLFGEMWCKLVSMLSCVSIYSSSLTSTVIAVDRYLVIVHPLKPRMTFRILVTTIITIWCVSTLIAVPLAVFNGLTTYEDGVVLCGEKWPSSQVKHLFSIGSFVLQFIIPLAIIAYCYSRTWVSLENRLKYRHRRSSMNPEREEREIRRRRRMTRMLCAMVSLYATCWMIFNLYTMVVDLALTSFEYEAIAFQIVHTVAVSSVVYNPLLYGWMNDNFRKQFTRMCVCLLRQARRTPVIIEGQFQGGAVLNEEASGYLFPSASDCNNTWQPAALERLNSDRSSSIQRSFLTVTLSNSSARSASHMTENDPNGELLSIG